MNNSTIRTPKKVLLASVIALLLLSFAFAAVTENSYAANEKNVPFENYIDGVENGVALMSSPMVIDLKKICSHDGDMAAQYNKGLAIRVYTKSDESSLDGQELFYDKESEVIRYVASLPIYFNFSTFQFCIEIGDWTFISGDITLLYNINQASMYDSSGTAIYSFPDVTYTGERFIPEVRLMESGFWLTEGEHYTVSFGENTNAGTATVTFTGNRDVGIGGECTRTFTINKAENGMKASGKTVKVRFAALKKKNQTVKASKAFKISGKTGTMKYKKTSGNGKISVASSGKITVKKGLKKGTYSIKVKVTDTGNQNYLAKTQSVKVKVKVS